jgi:ethanolamine ammonia-lyase small subunit
MTKDLHKQHHHLEHLNIDPWQQLKSFTRARIAIGRVGSSLPTKEVLDFGLSHAMARDAVHLALDIDALEADIRKHDFSTIRVKSMATDRATYLLRPDWGRRLHEQSLLQLQNLQHNQPNAKPIDFLIVVGDGLSSLAVARHAPPLLAEIKKICANDESLKAWSASRVVIASQARVAIGDEIGQAFNAKIVAMLIGERPGLSSPDSLGIYLTYNPKLGLSDADRNCISNVRPEGLQYAAAAKKLIWLAKEAMRLKVTGVALKDESDLKIISKNISAQEIGQ